MAIRRHSHGYGSSGLDDLARLSWPGRLRKQDQGVEIRLWLHRLQPEEFLGHGSGPGYDNDGLQPDEPLAQTFVEEATSAHVEDTEIQAVRHSRLYRKEWSQTPLDLGHGYAETSLVHRTMGTIKKIRLPCLILTHFRQASTYSESLMTDLGL